MVITLIPSPATAVPATTWPTETPVCTRRVRAAGQAHPLADLYEAAQGYQVAFERVHDQEGALHVAHQAARHHPECDPWVAAAASKLGGALVALGAAQTRITAAGERAAATATGAREEEQLLEAGYEEISVEQAVVDGDKPVLDKWDVWVPTYPGSNDAIYWDQLTTEELLAIHRRGQVTVWGRKKGCPWQPAQIPEIPERPEVVCLCGSTRFFDEFARQNLQLTIAGQIVLSIGCDTKSDGELFDPDCDHGGGPATRCGYCDAAAVKANLDELHKRKIDLADRVLILNVGGYIGESTRSEIAYAHEHGKPVDYLERVQS